jgi:hypothetical protein
MLAAEGPQPRTQGSGGMTVRLGSVGEGKSQQDGNGRFCEVRMIR